jgi:hypothetical protein
VLDADHPDAVRDNLKAAKAKHRLLKRLPKLETDKHLAVSDAGSILCAVKEYTSSVAEEEVALEDLV